MVRQTVSKWESGISEPDIEKLCADAREWDFASVCVNPCNIALCKELLAGTKMPVTQVALQCGFNSIATFNRVFRDVRGCTPTQYRLIYDESQRK